MSCNCPGRTKGSYLEAMAWILAWLGGKLEVLGEEPKVLVNVVKEHKDEIGI